MRAKNDSSYIAVKNSKGHAGGNRVHNM